MMTNMTPKQLRAATGLSQAKFAKAIRLSLRMMRYIERGEYPPNSTYDAWLDFYADCPDKCVKRLKKNALANGNDC
jgi:DNA-binding transcriptional regulator YiaG